jgi:hypothetical protein
VIAERINVLAVTGFHTSFQRNMREWGVCNPADKAQEERAMIESVNHVLAVALLATGMGFLTVDACAAPRAQAEFINQPTTYPFVCMTDEGYGSWTTCGGENGGI